MRLQTIEQVERRFHSAEAALADMSTRREFAELALDWTRFLNALDDGLSRLISGAQTDAASRRWFAARTKERRVDPLLSYLREARNTPEHGLHPTGKEVDMVLAKLVRIYNARSRIWFEAPTSHLGDSIPDTTPVKTAELALKYLGTLISECKSG